MSILRSKYRRNTGFVTFQSPYLYSHASFCGFRDKDTPRFFSRGFLILDYAHIQINYNGKPTNVHLREKTEDPINIIFECNIEGVGTIEIMQNDFGKWLDLTHKNTTLAQLIGMEKDRVEKLVVTADSFPLSVDYAGKTYDLTITPIPTDVGPYYRVVHGGKFLFFVFPPGQGQHQWHAGHGYEGDQKLAATIGMAIESK